MAIVLMFVSQMRLGELIHILLFFWCVCMWQSLSRCYLIGLAHENAQIKRTAS